MGIINDANPAFARLLGFNSPRDLIGKSIDVVIPEPIRTHHDRYMLNYLTAPHTNVIGQTRIVMAVHAMRHLVPMALYVRYENEELGKLLGVLQPISSSRESCLFVDPKTLAITAATANFASSFGYSRSAVLAQTVRLDDVIPEVRDTEGENGVNAGVYRQLVRFLSYVHISVTMLDLICFESVLSSVFQYLSVVGPLFCGSFA